MRRLMAVTLALVLAGCAADEGTASTTTEAAPRPTVPHPPDPDGLAEQIDQIYPGVPDGKAADWARSTCGDMIDGVDGDALVARVVARFAGGDRPDPTPEQAAAIIDLVEVGGWCTARG